MFYSYMDTPAGRLCIRFTQKEVLEAYFVEATAKNSHHHSETHRDYPEGIPFQLVGTPFQLKVWRALQDIPRGQTISYGQLAERIGHPKAVRAVGTAVGVNPIAYFIPCHRVIRGDGQLGGYRWGVERKKALLLAEEIEY